MGQPLRLVRRRIDVRSILFSHKPLRISFVKGVTDICLMAALFSELLDKFVSGQRYRSLPRQTSSTRRRNVCLVEIVDASDLDSHDHGSIGIVGYARLAISFSSI
jgi:hypothetical protein